MYACYNEIHTMKNTVKMTFLYEVQHVITAWSHCKNKKVVLTQLGCSFTAKECTYKQIS